MTIKQRIEAHLKRSLETKKKMLKENVGEIGEAALAIVETFYKKGGTVYTFGNGGSCADAQHIANELLCMLRKKYKKRRFPLQTHALTSDSTVLTAISNDLGFEYVFSRQLEALAKPEDLVIGLSTSGNSQNVIKGLELAKERGIKSIAFTGGDGGEIVKRKLAEIIIKVPADDVTHIQEGHEAAFHAMCDVVEEILFSEKGLTEG